MNYYERYEGLRSIMGDIVDAIEYDNDPLGYRTMSMSLVDNPIHKASVLNMNDLEQNLMFRYQIVGKGMANIKFDILDFVNGEIKEDVYNERYIKDTHLIKPEDIKWLLVRSTKSTPVKDLVFITKDGFIKVYRLAKTYYNLFNVVNILQGIDFIYPRIFGDSDNLKDCHFMLEDKKMKLLFSLDCANYEITPMTDENIIESNFKTLFDYYNEIVSKEYKEKYKIVC